MPPGGRRRGLPGVSKLLSALIAALLLILPTVSAAGSVIGIDVGTEYIKAALVKPGIPLEIVLTKDSKRKETSALAFKPVRGSSDELPERLYGGDALAVAARFPGDVYPNLKHLLAASQPGKDSIDKYGQRFPALSFFHHDNGTTGFKSSSFADGGAFSVEELLAMELSAIRGNAEAMAGTSVYDAVLTIPAFFTADERRALVTAAELAGLRVLGLAPDGTAVGLNYAMARTFAVPNETAKPEYHLVYDMGAGSTTATILRMQGKVVKSYGRLNKTIQEVSTIGLGWDRTLGGDVLNDLIVRDMLEQFVKLPEVTKLDITLDTVAKNGRAMAKLWREAERLRQVLSANTATSAFFESFYEDIDFRYKFTRADFEELTAWAVERVPAPINDALVAANLKLEDLTSVILHGGAIRTPFVQTALEQFVGDPLKLKSNVNADEAAVFGAAFKGAGLSPNFKVREIQVNDVAVYPVSLSWNANGKERSQVVFPALAHTGQPKQMPFKQLDDFVFSFSQDVQGTERPVLDVTTTNLTKAVTELINTHGCASENISATVSIRLDPVHGLPEATRGTLSCLSSEVEKKGVIDGVKDMFGFGKKDQKPLGEEEELIETETSTSTSASASATPSPSADKAKTGRKVVTAYFGLDPKPTGLLQPTGAELERIKQGLAALDASDKARRLREELFNGLESFTYRVRDLLTDADFGAVSTADQRAAIEKLRETTGEWLGGDGLSAGIDAIKGKLSDLKALIDPVQKRREEQTKRPAAIEKLQGLLGQASKLRDTVSSKVSEAASAAKASATAAPGADSASKLLDDLDKGIPNVQMDNDEMAASISSLMAQMTKGADPSTYTESDLGRISDLFESATGWLKDKVAAQAGLKDWDEPLLSSAQIEEQAKKLQKTLDEFERKARAAAARASSAASKRMSKPKTTTKTASSSSSSASADADADAVNEEPVTSTTSVTSSVTVTAEPKTYTISTEPGDGPVAHEEL